MTRALTLFVVLMAGWPALAQEAVIASGDSASAAAPAAVESVTDPSEPPPDPLLDPVGAWEADPRQVLPAEGVDLAEFQYLARPLVIFADSPRQPQVVEQLRLIEAEMDDLARRDVAVILDTDPGSRSAARLELRPRGFGIVLLDMDGRVLLRRPDPTDTRELGRTIDRSPLRQEEMRQGRIRPATD